MPSARGNSKDVICVDCRKGWMGDSHILSHPGMPNVRQFGFEEIGRIPLILHKRHRIDLVSAANWFPCRGEWLQTTAKAGDSYLTAPGPAYELKSSPQGVQPLRVMLVRLSTSLMTEAMTELFDKDASRVHLRDVSGFKDPCMSALMEKIRRVCFRTTSEPIAGSRDCADFGGPYCAELFRYI